MLPESVTSWLMNGERGISSEAIVSHLYKIPLNQYGLDHPYDPDDFKRCVKLLRWSPEVRERFGEMRTASRQWARLVDHWDEIERTFVEEVGEDWNWLRGKTAPRTYFLMKRILGAAETPDAQQT